MAVSHNQLPILLLEKINKVLDLCIDQELYTDLDKIVTLSPKAQKSKKELKQLKKGSSRKKKIPFTFDGYPVQLVEIPLDFIKFEEEPLKIILDNKSESSLLRHWSNLFWAKIIRAEIKKQNKEPWLKYYEDLIVFIETNMLSTNNTIEEKRTAFTFLMELSACAVGEASYGYAERARSLLKDIIRETELNERLDYGTAYDRWIWFNMGLAYQHNGLHQKAALEFNRVISKFWRYVSGPPTRKEKHNDDMNTDLALEFLLNIAPAIQQRASINLQLQLGYHALQTLIDEKPFWLDKLKKDKSRLFRESARAIFKKRCVIQLESLLQLDEIDEAERFFNTKVRPLVFPNAHEFEWKNDAIYLPPHEATSSESKVRLIEETVRWFLEKGKILNATLKRIPNSFDDNIDAELAAFTDRLTLIQDSYWKWAEDNDFDERVYFSRWAQSLKVAADILTTILNPKFNEGISKTKKPIEYRAQMLLKNTIRLYLARHDAIPVNRHERPKIKKLFKIETLQLENLRSDDLPDFIEGLGGFYKTISKYLMNNVLNDELRQLFTSGTKQEDPLQLLKKDHFRLLDALDEYEREFSEKRIIERLKMCKDSLIWLPDENRVSEDKCISCLKPEEIKEREDLLEKFNGLLSCGTTKEVQDHKESLIDVDYEKIMEDTEKHLTKHLESSSIHESGKNALHFLGLQRWNSLTPAQGRSVGGGYFIYRTDKGGRVDLGIAIDPGFDFVRNFFRMGFSLKDIDIVLISHAHADHLWDFESMIQLLNELEQKKHITHRLNVILTLGSYKRLEHVIANPILRHFLNPLVIDIRKELHENFLEEFKNNPFTFFQDNSTKITGKVKVKEAYSRWKPILPGNQFNENNTYKTVVEIRPTFAYHDDFSMISDSYGFLVSFPETLAKGLNGKRIRFGYTGDTKWVSDDLYNKRCPLRRDPQSGNCWKQHVGETQCWPCVASQYYDCDVILMHLGSLIDHKHKDPKKHKFEYYSSNPGNCEDLMREKNHPYLMGIIRFVNNIHKYASQSGNRCERLILLGEFGEELRGGIRADLAKRLQEGITKTWPVLPVDVGLDIIFHSYNQTSDNKERFEFLCAICESHQPIKRGTAKSNQVEFVRFGQDEAIFYFCKTCYKATPTDVMQNTLKQFYEIGKDLKY